MSPKGLFFTLLSILVKLVHLIKVIKGCDTINIACSDVKESSGYYSFRFEIPPTTKEIEIDQNRTSLVQGPVGNLSISDNVVACCNGAIIRRTCDNFMVKLILREGSKISERCLKFNTTEENKAAYSLSPWTPLGVTLVVVLVVVLVIMLVIAIYCYYRKRKRENKGCGLPLWCGGRKGSGGSNDEERAAEEENRVNNEEELQQHLLNRKSDGTEADGAKMVSINMDVMTTTNDDKGAPRVNGALPHQDQNGNLRHDPGGGQPDGPLHGLQSSNGHVKRGRTFGAQSSDRDEDGGPHSPCSQRSARPGFDEEKGQALVNSQGPGGNDNTPPEEKEKGETMEPNNKY